ncbi:hypothetical protein [Nesterenkonia populi]
MKWMRNLTGVGLAAMLCLGGAAAAHGHEAVAEEPIGGEGIDELQQEWDEYAVPHEDQLVLLEKLEEGVPFDAFSAEEAPVSEEVLTEGGVERTVQRYADGSYVVTTMEEPVDSADNDALAPFGTIDHCSVSVGSGYRAFNNCSVANNWSGIINVAFTASYEIYSGAPSQITNLGQVTQNCGVVSCTRPTLDLIQAQSTASSPAIAQAQSTVTGGVLGSWEVWLQLRVSDSGASTLTS